MTARFAICLLFTSLAACATYAPDPLGAPGTILRGQTEKILSRDAETIDRPYLTPAHIDLSQPLDANAVALIAVIANPDLKALRARAQIASAQVFEARLLPDPTFSLGADTVLSGPDHLANLIAALGLDLNALRTQPVRASSAEARRRQVRLDVAWAEWQTAGNARIQAVRCLYLRRQLILARASRDAANGMLDRMLRASGRGDLSPDQVQSTRLAVLDAEDRYRTIEHGLSTAEHELVRLLGLPPGSGPILADTALPSPAPSTDALFAIAESDRTDLQALRAGYEVQEAAVRKAVMDQFPNLTFTINGNRDSAGNTLVGPALDFTLPVWNANRGGIAVERATRAALKAEFDARLIQTRSEIAAAVDSERIDWQQREALLSDLPGITDFAKASRQAANRGDLAEATAEAAEQASRDKQLLLEQTEQSIAEQSIVLEMLTGALQETWRE